MTVRNNESVVREAVGTARTARTARTAGTEGQKDRRDRRDRRRMLLSKNRSSSSGALLALLTPTSRSLSFPFVCLSVFRSVGLSVCRFVGLSVCLFVCLSVCRFVGLSVYPSAGLLFHGPFDCVSFFLKMDWPVLPFSTPRTPPSITCRRKCCRANQRGVQAPRDANFMCPRVVV